MYWIYLIDNLYCVVDRRNNIIIAKFLNLEDAVTFLKSNNRMNQEKALLPKNDELNLFIENNTNQVNQTDITLKDIEENFKKINEKLESIDKNKNNLLEEIYLLKANFDKNKEISNIEKEDITEIVNDK